MRIRMSYSNIPARQMQPRTANSNVARCFKTIVCFVIALLSVVLPDTATAEDSGLSAKQKAFGNIPFERMTASATERIKSTINSEAVYKHLPESTIQCSPELYIQLVRYPELVCNMWELMGAAKFRVNRIGEFEFTLSDLKGNTSQVELIYGTHETHVFLIDGKYKGPLLVKNIKAKTVVVVHSSFELNDKSEPITRHSIDLFMKLDSGVGEIVEGVVVPLFMKATEWSYDEITKFVGQVYNVALTKPDGMHRLINKLTRCQPAIRKRLSNVTTAIAESSVRTAALPK